ncbi:hypothetical protein J6590_007025 [Homalodisca vitripennis]|nr:hypothetical protein J6590_007025 [Homalodisca vitripennis]
MILMPLRKNSPRMLVFGDVKAVCLRNNGFRVHKSMLKVHPKITPPSSAVQWTEDPNQKNSLLNAKLQLHG